MFSPSNTPTPTFPYRIEAKIGEGAMGVVYRAEEPLLGRKVAIKTLRLDALANERPDLAHEFRHRFVQEARAAAALSHPGVTSIYRIGEEDGTLYIAMEWLEGETLERIIGRDAPLAPARAAKFGADLLDALDAAHRAGVVHRDVKPSNLVVLSDGRLKVTDFGIAYVQGSDLVRTQPGLVLATPQFAAPEQLAGAEVDGRCDVYAASVVLYYALTGRLPFNGRNVLELVTAIARTEPQPIRALAPNVPPALEAIVLRGLRKERDERYRSAAEMADALRPFVAATQSFSDPHPSEFLTAVGPAAQTGTATTTMQSERRTADTSPQTYAAPMTVASSSTPMPAAPTPVAPTAPAPGPAAPYPTLIGAPRTTHGALVHAVRRWPSRAIGRGPCAELVDRLLERPLHTAPFAGAVVVGDTCLLVHDGFVVGAVDARTGRIGDEVCESLPAEAEATLHPVPDGTPAGVVPLLASLLAPGAVRHANMDSSIVNLAGLARKLGEERFTGVLRFERQDAAGPAHGALLFDEGSAAMAVFSEGWDDIPVDQTWERWMSLVSMRATLEERGWNPLSISLRRALRNFKLNVRPAGGGTSGLGSTLKLFGGFRKTSAISAELADGPRVTPVAPPPGADSTLHERDFAYRLLEWSLADLPGFFQERDRAGRWKYLVEWLSLVRNATLHHALPRPDSRETDEFDLVTFDGDGKVLHLAHRVARGTPEALATFLDRVIAAKTARIKTGDVGGAILVSPSFDASTIEAYREKTRPDTVGRKVLGLEDKFTGYEGFVRIGPRRGFHLLLVEERPTGLTPLLVV